MDPGDLPALLKRISDRAADAAPSVVLKIADIFEDYVKNVELVRFSHPPFTKTPSPAWIGPPAEMTGDLRRSVHLIPGSLAPILATAAVAPDTVYAAIQEWGGVITPKRRKMLSWTEDGVRHYAKRVIMPDRPYMRPSVQACAESGAFARGASDVFELYVWGD